MIKTFSQRLTPPYSGQIQIAESERARALSVDGDLWEIHFVHGVDPGANSANRRFRRVTSIRQSELAAFNEDPERNGARPDERIIELTKFLEHVSLPFPAADRWEYWLLDPVDDLPLAMIFSCTEAEHITTFPDRPEWTALPAAQMKIEANEAEKENAAPPVNYQLERLVAERAGYKPQARWYQRRSIESDIFPALMLREDWEKPEHESICRRYLNRQSTRLLMLHGLEYQDRKRMEIEAKPHAFEVLRYSALYPEHADDDLMNTILVEARIRKASGELDNRMDRRDGVLYQ